MKEIKTKKNEGNTKTPSEGRYKKCAGSHWERYFWMASTLTFLGVWGFTRVANEQIAAGWLETENSRQEWIAAVEGRDAEIAIYDKWLSLSEKTVEIQEDSIEHLEDSIEHLKGETESNERAISAKNETIGVLEETIDARDKAIDSLERGIKKSKSVAVVATVGLEIAIDEYEKFVGTTTMFLVANACFLLYGGDQSFLAAMWGGFAGKVAAASQKAQMMKDVFLEEKAKDISLGDVAKLAAKEKG